MAKFTFDLQQVLDFRNFEKEKAEGELAKALAVESEINNNLKIIAEQYAATNKKMDGSLNFDDIVSQSQFFNLLNYQKEELLKQLAQAKLVSEEKRKILAECMKKTTALEKLKENQLAEFKAAEDYAEAEFIDDLATGHYKK